MTEHSALPDTIRARVHETAIHRVTRFYDAGIASIFVELIQNSRRSGATAVDVAADELPDETVRITVADDGDGIADPAVLLSFGQTGWDDETAQREDAAGMGVYALSQRGCTISSRPRGPLLDLAPGWRVDLTPDCFLGKIEVPVIEGDAPFPHGTSVSFAAPENIATIRNALAGAALHAPLRVSFNGEAMERKAFLDGALHAESWRGVTFGVFNDARRGFQRPDLNFHGLTLTVGLPRIEAVEGGTWSVLADVFSCPDLQLVLPARKEAVETSFLAEMRDAARLAIYRAVAQADPAPRVAFRDHDRAARAGIALPVPPPELRPYRPAIADSNDWLEIPAFALLPADALVVSIDPEPQDSQAFWRAADRNGTAPQLFDPELRYDGYDWYDALPRVTELAIEFDHGGETFNIESLRSPDKHAPDDAAALDRAADVSRPDAIRMRLSIAGDATWPDSIALDADVAFAGEGWSFLDDAHPLVTRGSDIDPGCLRQLLYAAFFGPSDDPDADSYETQRTRFQDDAMHMALRLLASEEEAQKHTIAETVYRELLWAIPRDRRVSITVDRGRVSVDLCPENAQPEGAPA